MEVKKEQKKEEGEWREGLGGQGKRVGGKARLSGPECCAVLCHGVLTCSITHITDLFINPLSEEHKHTHTHKHTHLQRIRVSLRCRPHSGLLLDSVVFDALLVVP